MNTLWLLLSFDFPQILGGPKIVYLIPSKVLLASSIALDRQGILQKTCSVYRALFLSRLSIQWLMFCYR